MFEHYWDNIKALLWNSVWAVNLAALPAGRAGVVRWLRVAHMVARELGDGQLNVRAASLVYTTLLSLVPVLAVSFSVLKAFDVHYEMMPLLISALEPLGQKGVEIGTRILGFVENVKVGGLGALGVVLLLFTVISLLQKVERAFNYAWRVERPRRLAERVSGYLTVVLVGPVLVFTALGVTASVTRHSLYQEAVSYAPLGALASLGGKVLPYLLVIAAFALVYLYIPNTKVRLRSALVGAGVAGFLWASAGWGFASLVVGSTKYTAIYSSFAILVLFMMWVYIGWLILLVGASIAFYHQNPEYLGMLTHEVDLSSRVKERVGLAACLLIARAHLDGEPAPGSAGLASRLGVPLAPLEGVLSGLERQGILVRAAGDAPAYVPARDLARTRLADVLAAVRSVGEARRLGVDRLRQVEGMAAFSEELDATVDAALGERTLRDLAMDRPVPGPERDRGGAVPISSAQRER